MEQEGVAEEAHGAGGAVERAAEVVVALPLRVEEEDEARERERKRVLTRGSIRALHHPIVLEWNGRPRSKWAEINRSQSEHSTRRPKTNSARVVLFFFSLANVASSM